MRKLTFIQSLMVYSLIAIPGFFYSHFARFGLLGEEKLPEFVLRLIILHLPYLVFAGFCLLITDTSYLWRSRRLFQIFSAILGIVSVFLVYRVATFPNWEEATSYSAIQRGAWDHLFTAWFTGICSGMWLFTFGYVILTRKAKRKKKKNDD